MGPSKLLIHSQNGSPSGQSHELFYNKYGALPVTQFTKNQSLFLKSLAHVILFYYLVRARTVPIVVQSLSVLPALFPMNQV